MAKTAPSVEAMLAWLRDPKVDERSPGFADLAGVHARMCSAIADWIDAARMHEHGSYAEALSVLDQITHTFPAPPRDDSFEKIVESLVGERPAEPTAAPDARAAGEGVEVLTVDLYDTESHKNLPPYIQDLVRELRADMGLNDEEN
ncbi:hypothetical protein SEA_BAILEYBLU_52 [Arthrobacter phage BaileyBlu]|uniref:Uncharacterized protein n=1 Tax=Arthrobacter phage BaileyBlu TaxID=2910754 RepID=A0AA49BNH2_9CAUD|nr:hypothetical protein PQD78_gp52 [Arthrobacter phage BaileyBlu]UJQ87190.1 hypothetical protein SEA_BAILEYBLU_52 [Arthrobacter phage BaileyBlu]